ncbi:hypothetical protein [Streptomyces shenzhenensis]|uniref:hypothetical protein n=1 Tax=Streptomyces shenzhenensis TaxID=943815 RepID=UPI0033D4353E
MITTTLHDTYQGVEDETQRVHRRLDLLLAGNYEQAVYQYAVRHPAHAERTRSPESGL